VNDPDPITFLLDEDVPHDIAAICRARGHRAHTVQEVPPHRDVDIREYAIERGFVLISHDSDFVPLAGRVVIGKHVQLSGAAPEVAGYFRTHFETIVGILRSKQDVFVTVGRDEVSLKV
jgi:predicted nuclease of predicted toxin-antitoxin system